MNKSGFKIRRPCNAVFDKSPDIITKEKVRIWYPRTVGYLCGQRQGKPSKGIFHKSKGVARKCIGIVGTAHTILVNYPHYHPRYPPKLDHGAFCVRRQFFLASRCTWAMGLLYLWRHHFSVGIGISNFSTTASISCFGIWALYLLPENFVLFDIEPCALV